MSIFARNLSGQFASHLPRYFVYTVLKGFGFGLITAIWVIYLQPLQSLTFVFLVAISEPILGFVADQSGLPAAYVGLAGSLGLLTLFLFWKSRRHFP